jgi:F-type H+-transporting ATPase subunit b
MPRARLIAAALILLPGAAAAQEAAGGGMPQLNFNNPLTISQLVWFVIIFAVLFVLLRNMVLPRVAEVVEGRAATIKADLDAAQQAKEEADAAVAELNAAIRRAHSEAQARIADAVARAKADAGEQARVANERLEQQLRDAEARIGEARRAAMGALRDVAKDTTAFVVSRLTGQPADAPAVDAAVGSVLAARSQS